MTPKIAVISVVSSCLILHSAFGQGALTPSGAPAPSMKSLAQIEPRTPISSAPFNITASGSYYLTTNISVSSGNAIVIAANNVTLDLNGFTIASTAASATTEMAILLNGGRTNVAELYNGHISGGVTNSDSGVFGGGGFAFGIFASGNIPYNVRVKDVSVVGVLYHGIALSVGNSTVVESCSVNVAGGIGIYADSVSDSTAMNCGSAGVFAGTAHNCKGSGIGGGYGLYATSADNCFGQSAGNSYGLYTTGVATGCYGSSSSGTGLNAPNANNCFGQSAGSGIGLLANTANNCEGVSSSGTGLYAFAVATSCYGSSSSGLGLYALIASVCNGTSISSPHNINSFTGP